MSLLNCGLIVPLNFDENHLLSVGFVMFNRVSCFIFKLLRYNYFNDLPSLDPELYRHLIFLKVISLTPLPISSCITSYISSIN